MELQILENSVGLSLGGVVEEANQFFTKELLIFSPVIILEKSLNSGVSRGACLSSASTDEVDTGLRGHVLISFTVLNRVEVEYKVENDQSLGVNIVFSVMNRSHFNHLVFVGAFGFQDVSVLEAKLLHDLAVVFIGDFSTVGQDKLTVLRRKV